MESEYTKHLALGLVATAKRRWSLRPVVGCVLNSWPYPKLLGALPGSVRLRRLMDNLN